MPGVRLSAANQHGGSVRWALRDGVSYRCYTARKSTRASFCVSTRGTEAVVLLDGDLTYEFGARRQTIRLRAGDVALVAPSTPQARFVSVDARFVVFDLPADPSQPAWVVASSPAMTALAERLWERDEEVRAQDIRQTTCDRQLIGAQSFRIEPVHQTFLMNRIRAHLEAQFTEPVSLAAVARAHGVDAFYLSRTFKRQFSVTPTEYLQFLRTERFVWSLLHASTRRAPSLTAVASAAGFGDYATFSRRMRARFGKAPSELIVNP